MAQVGLKICLHYCFESPALLALIEPPAVPVLLPALYVLPARYTYRLTATPCSQFIASSLSLVPEEYVLEFKSAWTAPTQSHQSYSACTYACTACTAACLAACTACTASCMQFIASSPSLFPEEYVLEFQKCLDRTDPVPYSTIRGIMQQELKGRSIESIFSYINPEPLASASVAQVGTQQECLLACKVRHANAEG